jgi:hypothetical protein
LYCCANAQAEDVGTAIPGRLPSVDASEPVEQKSFSFDENTLPIQYDDTGLKLMEADARMVSPSLFGVGAYDQPVASQIGNNFTAFPEFDDGILVVNDNVALKIGG